MRFEPKSLREQRFYLIHGWCSCLAAEVFDWNEDQFLQMNGKTARASIREIFRSKISSRNLIRFYSSTNDLTSLYHPSLLPLQKCQTITQLHQIHAHLITSGLFHHTFPASRVLKSSSDFKDFDYTILIFNYIHTPDTFCVNTVIGTYSKTSHGRHRAVPFYFDMMSKGFIPNSFTFTSLLNSCVEICFGEKCHGQAVKNGVDNVVQVQNCLINMYGNFGCIDSAWKMFDEMSDRDLVSWNSIVNGYVKFGELGIAHKIFDKMPVKNEISFNTMISGYWKGGNPGCGLKVFREMIKMGFRGSETTVVSVVTACGRSGRLKEGRSVHGSFIRKFMKSNLIIDTALIDMYSKCQRVESARRVFDNMLERNLVCWNAMVLGHCLHGCPEDGIALFEAMVERVDPQNEGSGHNESNILLDGANVVAPDEVTFIGVLCACVRLGSVSKGRDYFNQLANVYSLKPNFAHYWCMANLYDGAGLIPEAEEILRSMPHETEDGLPESLVWGSLLGSCRFRGDVDLGVKIAMRLIELEPENASRYMLLFNIYAVAGRWEDTVKVKDMMKDRGVKRIPSCSLVGLNEVVHEFRLEENSQPCMGEVYTMLDELAQRLRLPMTGAFSLSDKAENRSLLRD